MFSQQTIQMLVTLKLLGALKRLRNMIDDIDISSLSTDEILAMLLESEIADREQRKQNRSLTQAKLKERSACVENIDFNHPRGLDRSVIRPLYDGRFIAKSQHMIITGETGTGKTYIACALANQAIRHGYSALYMRLPRLLEELEIAHADGSLPKKRARLAKFKLLILDDWAVNPMTARNRQDLFELIEDKTDSGSIIVTSQLPINRWHDWIGEPTIADAILDRLVHRAHKISLKGESMRKRYKFEEETPNDNS